MSQSAIETAKSRYDLARALLLAEARLSRPQLHQVMEKLQHLGEPLTPFRIAVVRSFTTELLDPWLTCAAALEGFDAQVYHAPYGLNPHEAQPGSGLHEHGPELTLLMLRREDLHPALSAPGLPLAAGDRQVALDDVKASFQTILSHFRTPVAGFLCVCLLPDFKGPALGQYDRHHAMSELGFWDDARNAFARMVESEHDGTVFMDLEDVLKATGVSTGFDARMWYTSAFPFNSQAAFNVSRHIARVMSAMRKPRPKVLVLDADNTLWGGIVGEDGPNGIALGPDYPGNAFVAWQKRLLDYKNRGLVLALCSKNNPGDVDDILDRHPHQLIRQEDLVAKKVNWLPKPENIMALSKELNLGLDSFIFIDDSDFECDSVRQALPDVEIVKTPKNPFEIPSCLEHIGRLEVLSLTSEDFAKTRMYAEEGKRRSLQASFLAQGGDITDYLKSLSLEMDVHFDDTSNTKRLSQLTQKTNQFNLTTRRYQENEIEAFLGSDDWLVAHFRLRDKFGDNGIVGLAIMSLADRKTAVLDSFMMSCRVIGRKAETGFLMAIMKRLADMGIPGLRAHYLPTRKNELVARFLPDHGFELQADGSYVRRTDALDDVSDIIAVTTY